MSHITLRYSYIFITITYRGASVPMIEYCRERNNQPWDINCIYPDTCKLSTTQVVLLLQSLKDEQSKHGYNGFGPSYL